jgi:hypothetical protein
MEQSRGGGSCPRSSTIEMEEKDATVSAGKAVDFGNANSSSAL